MLILPAIDLLDGQCVRLLRGEYGSAGQVAEDPLQTALAFVRRGAKMLHTVDLNGAKSGLPENFEMIAAIVRSTGIPVEVGGGIRTMETIERYLSAGISRVILGTSALRDPDFLRAAVKKHAAAVAVGIDARDGMVCVDGWTSASGVPYTDFARMMEKLKVDNLIFTDIEKDGTLSEPNFEQLALLQKTVGVKITASGGIRDVAHIRRLQRMGLYAAICGKSLYSGTLKLEDALEAATGAER